jgi:hypothetical protein
MLNEEKGISHMTTVTVGDLVTVRGEFYAVLELVNSVPLGYPPDALLTNGKDAPLRVSTAALVPLSSPIFETGQAVGLPLGRHGVVARDIGQDTVDVTEQRATPPLGKHAKTTYTTPVSRRSLVAANLESICKTLDN